MIWQGSTKMAISQSEFDKNWERIFHGRDQSQDQSQDQRIVAGERIEETGTDAGGGG